MVKYIKLIFNYIFKIVIAIISIYVAESLLNEIMSNIDFTDKILKFNLNEFKDLIRLSVNAVIIVSCNILANIVLIDKFNKLVYAFTLSFDSMLIYYILKDNTLSKRYLTYIIISYILVYFLIELLKRKDKELSTLEK